MKIQVTNVETGKTSTMGLAEFYRTFGKHEGREILAGHLPNIVAIKVNNNDTLMDELTRN